jgi:hypothetical protein
MVFVNICSAGISLELEENIHHVIALKYRFVTAQGDNYLRDTFSNKAPT